MNCLLLILFIIIIFILYDKKEDFYSGYDFGNTPSYNFNYDYNYGTQCTNCKSLTNAQCGRCVNCGICYTDENPDGECLAGDKTGPYFRPKYSCNAWQYKNYPLNNSVSNIEWPPYNVGGAANWMRKYKWDSPYQYTRWDDWRLCP